MRLINIIFLIIFLSCSENKNRYLHKCKVIKCTKKPISSIHDEIEREVVFIIKTDCDFYYTSKTSLKIGDSVSVFK